MSNFWKRTIFGALYVAVLIGCVLWCKYSFLALMCFLTGGMICEFLHITMGGRYKYSQILTILGGVLFFLLVWCVRAIPVVTAKYCLLAFVPLLVVMVNSIYVKDKTSYGQFANLYTSILYIAIPMAVMNFLVMDPSGNYNGLLLVYFFILIWTSDIGAYLFGMALGQKYGKKLCPSISPKKSWIGFWGGFACTIAVSLAMYFSNFWSEAGIQSFSWYHSVILAILVDVFGVYGDLFESLWKRHYDVKDSGNIIPGHGGLLDRLDSTIFAVPVGITYLSLFNLI